VTEEKLNFDNALDEWRRKYAIRDDDAVLQMLELLKIFFRNVKVEIPSDTNSIRLITIRVSLQTLTQIAKEFARDARELKQEIQTIPKISQQLAAGRSIAFLCVTVSSLLAGILIGKFLL
jgi:hypothetical protein